MNSYPYSIDNGAGERLTFTRCSGTAGGERLEGESLVAPGAGPPMHVHYQQEEGFTVLQGRLGYQIAGREPRFAGEGESIVFPAGEPHRFWNAGEQDLRCAAYITPPGNIEYFLGSIFASQRENGGRRPQILDAAYLTRKYRGEYSMLVIPAVVQRLVFPVLVALGTLMGKYGKYADAPRPLDAPARRR